MKATASTGCLISGIMATMLWASPTVSHSASIKCWVNEENIRECGSVIPPEFAQKEHQKLDQEGRTREQIDAAPTAEELDAQYDVAKAEMEEQARLEKERMQDKALLHTFNRVEDIEHSAEEKLAALRSNILLLERRNTKLNEKLESDLHIAAKKEMQEESLPENLEKAIHSQRKQIRNNQETIDQYKMQMKSIRQDADENIARFKKIKTQQQNP